MERAVQPLKEELAQIKRILQEREQEGRRQEGKKQEGKRQEEEGKGERAPKEKEQKETREGEGREGGKKAQSYSQVLQKDLPGKKEE